MCVGGGASALPLFLCPKKIQMRYINNYKNRGVMAYERRKEKPLGGNYEERLVEIIAKFGSTCRETGNQIKAGERIAWLPKTGVVFCDKSTHYARMIERRKQI